jgi:hypothetical protein
MNKVINVTKRSWIIIRWNYFVASEYDWHSVNSGNIYYGLSFSYRGWRFELMLDRVVGD